FFGAAERQRRVGDRKQLDLRLPAIFLIRCSGVGSFFFQAEDGIRDRNVTGVQTCALPILPNFPIKLAAVTCESAPFRINSYIVSGCCNSSLFLSGCTITGTSPCNCIS